jgi:hypothetical protein
MHVRSCIQTFSQGFESASIEFEEEAELFMNLFGSRQGWCDMQRKEL